ncbi:hypothetical protein H4R26_002088 [Coemansia thaxteri]|uniref:Acyltransferase n=1 Tax=Coemansia thaxteri TaxID=2663907 RepID=A0A9W8BKH6_9FUNG|nr:hypothetical protein H4R26_002088 [Coemansia thaxteri]KAJ2487964.1 hypothetical protein EV174_000201 [Coemansia sp. RSA 2320]
MEDLFASIESSEVMLSAQDALFSFANHPLVHFYENTSNGGSHIGFMPSAVLQASLYTALKDFPLLLGHIKDGPGGLAKIVVDKHGLNLPEFVESESSIHYQSLKEAQFKWSTWPKGVATVGPTTAPNKHGAIKLLNVHIVRLHEDSGLILFCNIPHYILDGFGYYAFLSHWAAICRTFCRQEPPLTEQHCQPLYTFDRAIVDEGLQGQRCPLERPVIDMFTGSRITAKLLTLLSYSARTRLVSMCVNIDFGHAHLFRVSRESLAELRDQAKARIASSADISTYAVLAAFMCTSVCRAQNRSAREQIFFVRAAHAAAGAISSLFGTGQPQYTLVNMVHVHESLNLGSGRCYIGNPVILQPIRIPLDILSLDAGEESLAKVASQATLALGGITAPLVGEFVDFLNANPNAYARYAAYMAAATNVLTIIDERGYHTQSVDFGHGGPTWVSGIPWHIPNFVAFFASPARPGDVDVYVSHSPRVADALAKDAFFAKYARLLF